jgi:hypothetical protein
MPKRTIRTAITMRITSMTMKVWDEVQGTVPLEVSRRTMVFALCPDGWGFAVNVENESAVRVDE